jgi:uncharacterized damage-inducible protein DinB
MLANEARSLLLHMEWADGLTWGALLGLPASRHDPGLLDRLYHLHSVQWAYLQIWRGEPLQIPERASFGDLPSLNLRARAYYRELSPFVEALQDAELERTVEFPWAEQVAKRYGSAAPATLSECILQVALHTVHHRGQVATRIRELGGEPPPLDFIAWLWMGRPAAPWKDGEIT